jgi:hypothetical protein
MSALVTHADTAWGQVCAAIHARLLVDFPSLTLGIGPDGASLNKAAPSCVFERPEDETIAPGLRGAIYDRMIPIRVTLWMADPVAAEQAWLRFLIALNFGAHGRASRPVRAKSSGGEIGASGAKIAGLFLLRLAVVDEPAPTAPVEDVALAAAALTNPAGAETEEAPLGA